MIRWLGQLSDCVQWSSARPCPQGHTKVFDPACPSGWLRCAPGAIEPCTTPGEAFYSAVGRCVPIACFPGTVRDLSTFNCVPQGLPTVGPTGPITLPQQPSAPPPIPPPAPGECLDAQEVTAAQPCFYFDQAGNYVGPPELVQGVDTAQLYSFCLQTFAAGYFDLPLCDTSTLPPPPSCIDPETRRILTYCQQQGATGPDRNANYFCWFANKAGPLFGEWISTPDCAAGQEPITQPGQEPITRQPAAEGRAVVPLLIGAAVVEAVVYFLS